MEEFEGLAGGESHKNDLKRKWQAKKIRFRSHNSSNVKKKKKKKIYKIEGMDVKLVSKNVTHKPTDEKICSFCFKIMQNSKWFDICLLRRNERRGND